MGFSIWHLLVVLLIILVLFGTKRLRTIGSDLGGAVKGFRDSMGGDAKDEIAQREALDQRERVIDAKAEVKDKDRA